MIPLRDENPTEIVPFATIGFVALNLASWFIMQGAGNLAALEASVYALGVVPCELTLACEPVGLRWGAIFSSMFAHGSWGHLLGNMLFLWVFGNNIEDSMGHIRYLVFYFACGLAAMFAHVYFAPTSSIPAVGASGAISGVMGAYVVLYPRVRVHTWFPPFFFFDVRAFFLLGYWFFIQLATGVVSIGPEAGQQGGVAVWAHVGGFVAGVVLIKIFEKPALTRAKRAKVKLPPSDVARLEW